MFSLFNSIDRDHNGKLDKEELKAAFRRAGLAVPNSKLDQFFGEVDKNHDVKLYSPILALLTNFNYRAILLFKNGGMMDKYLLKFDKLRILFTSLYFYIGTVCRNILLSASRGIDSLSHEKTYLTKLMGLQQFSSFFTASHAARIESYPFILLFYSHTQR